jgi:hypothetical protein
MVGMEAGKLLLGIGLVIAIIGALMMSGVGFGWFGRLPGDIHVERDGFSFHFPVVTCILVSVVLTLLSWLVRR